MRIGDQFWHLVDYGPDGAPRWSFDSKRFLTADRFRVAGYDALGAVTSWPQEDVFPTWEQVQEEMVRRNRLETP
jgi:hypothetical protein